MSNIRTMEALKHPIVYAQELMQDNKSKLLTAATVVGLGIAAMTGCGEKEEAPASANAKSTVACDVEGFANHSSDSSGFDDTAFLPKAPEGIDDAEEAEKYIYDNPVVDVDKLDPNSLAALMSAVTTPANDGEITPTSYNYIDSFESSLSAYASENGGLDRAKTDCGETVNTLIQTAEFNDSWAEKGEKVVRISAVRDENYEVEGMKLEKLVATETLSGIEVKVRDTSKGKDGFTPVLITADGNMLVKGVVVEKQAEKDKKDRDGKQGDQNRKAKGQSRSGAQGGGGSGKGEGKGGGKGGDRGGGCGNDCGDGNKGGDRGGGGKGGGKGCETDCAGGDKPAPPPPSEGGGTPPPTGGGDKPTPEPQPEPTPEPTPEPNKGTETPPPPVPDGY